MMKILCSLFVYFVTPFVFSLQLGDRTILTIQSFGIRGDNVPTFLDSRPGDTFFSMSMEDAFINRKDYTGNFDFDIFKRGIDGSELEKSTLLLNLINKSDAKASIVISAAIGIKTQNFLIRLQPYSDQIIDASMLLPFDRVSFISVQSFESHFLLETGFGRIFGQSVAVSPPIRSGRSYDYCANEYSRVLRVAVKPEIVGFYEDAWFERLYVGDRPNHSCLLYEVLPYHILNVYWPTSDILHHDGLAHKESSCDIRGPCIKEAFATTAVGNGNDLAWNGYDYYFSIPSPYQDFDDVLFGDACGVATCQTGGGVSGEICTVNPDALWYIYDKDILPCPSFN